MSTIPEWYRAPSQILSDLGIQEPVDIDIEAIAEDCGATIRYQALTGCAARIMGYKNRAIITVDNSSPRPRQRFSAGHELGHWMKDRGQVSFQCAEKKLIKEWSQENPEHRANRFATDILLPPGMFRKYCNTLPPTFASVEQLATVFNTSLTATAIRLVEYGDYSAMLICTNRQKREWFVPGGEVKGKLWPKDFPGSGSIARELMRCGVRTVSPRDVGADEWISHPNSSRYWLHEESRLFANDFVLTLLWWRDEKQIIDLDEAEELRSAKRSDWRDE
jgi:Zn-dependent peptidase ImmA (M78 family)